MKDGCFDQGSLTKPRYREKSTGLKPEVLGPVFSVVLDHRDTQGHTQSRDAGSPGGLPRAAASLTLSSLPGKNSSTPRTLIIIHDSITHRPPVGAKPYLFHVSNSIINKKSYSTLFSPTSIL